MGGIAPSHGPRYGITSVTATTTPKSNAYCCACGRRPAAAEHPQAEPGARADDQREQRLAANVRRERVLHAPQQRVLASSRRIAPVDRAAEPLHVEQHVHRDDDQQHQREQRLADRDRRALDERDDLVRVLADVALLDLTHELVAALPDVHRLEVMRVEPVLEAVDVAVGRGLSDGAVTIREVPVEPVGRRLRLSHDGGRHRHDDRNQHRQEAQVHERDREAARQAAPLEAAHERVEQQRDQGGDQEQEDARDPAAVATTQASTSRTGRPTS